MLFHGPDRGLVRERSEALAATVLAGDRDPFRLIEMAAGELRAAPPALVDAARSFPLLPGRQVIRVRDAGDAAIEAFRLLIDSGGWEALVVVEAGDLSRRSLLRGLFETAAGVAAVACYADDDSALRLVIAETLAGFGVQAEADAADLLAAWLGADRALSRQELTKLALYCGDGQTVRVEDVQAVVGDGSAASLADIAFAAAGGDVGAVNRALAGLGRGIEAIGLLRAVQGHLQRLHRVQADVARGRGLREAVQALRPPVFFRAVDAFSRQARCWRREPLEASLAALLEAERACKRTGAPQAALAAAAVLSVARQGEAWRDGNPAPASGPGI